MKAPFNKGQLLIGTDAERIAILASNLSDGVVFWTTDTDALYVWAGAAWAAIGGGGGGATLDHDHSGDPGDGNTFDAANLTSGASGDGDVLTSDGAGGAAWEAPVGGGSNHAYYSRLAALLEPDAIEPRQISDFSYVVGSNETNYVLLGWWCQLNGVGRIDIRNPVDPLPLRGITLTGLHNSDPYSIAAILDPALPSYINARETYFDRLNIITTLPTKWVGPLLSHFLPGPYGSIITHVTCFDSPWVCLKTGMGTTSFAIDSEVSDVVNVRFAHQMRLPITKALCSVVWTNSGSGGIAFVDVPSNWSVITDPLTYTFRDDFTGASLDTATIWTRAQSTVGNVEIDSMFDWCKIIGSADTWGINGAYTQSSYARSSQPYLLIDFSMAPTTSSPTGFMVGWSDGGGHSYTNFAHGLLCQTNEQRFKVYEDGNDRGVVGSGLTKGCIYRVRIRPLSGGGASYELQGGIYGAIGSSNWTNITPGTTSSAINTLHPAFAAAGSDTNYVGDIRVY